MNQNRKEELLTRWMDGALSTEELHELEPVLEEQPELRQERENYLRLRKDLQSAIPAEVEPPYPDFFNVHLKRLVEEASRPAEPPVKGASEGLGRLWSWWMAPAGLAALVGAFMAGTLLTTTDVPPPLSAATAVYSPDEKVEVIAEEDAALKATVIVLSGLDDLADDNLIGWRGSQVEGPAIFVTAHQIY